MFEVTNLQSSVEIGERFSLSFQRTLRIPEDGRTYPLPPRLGRIPVQRVEDYPDKVPEHWNVTGGFFIPMYQREALWLSFNAARWKPNAVKIGIGRINAVSGTDWEDGLREEPQNYVVCPDQPWLDGINAGDGFIRQFVAMPLGMGYTVEGQLTGNEEFGGIQIQVYEPKPGLFPDEPPADEASLDGAAMYSPPSRQLERWTVAMRNRRRSTSPTGRLRSSRFNRRDDCSETGSDQGCQILRI